jgi:protein O-GlcNAc transferase
LSQNQGQWQRAAEGFQAVLALEPKNAQAHVELGRVLRQKGAHAQAAQHFDRAAGLLPNKIEFQLTARLHRGAWLEIQGRPEQALAVYQQLVQQYPDEADPWAALGQLQWRLPAHGAAVAQLSFQRALQIDASRAELVECFAQTLQEQRQFEDAALCFERVLKMEPLRPLNAGRLMHCKMLAADWTSLSQLQQHVESELAAGRLASEPFGLQGYGANAEILLACARAYATAVFPDKSASLPPASFSTGSKIRVGYVAGEFRNQATSVLLTEVLERHDKSQFEIYAFDNGWDDGSALRQRINAAVNEVVPIRALNDADATQAIRHRGIDILVNLNGYFGLARTGLFSLRPAPVQVNYLGFPGTMGAPYIDYLIADAVVVPAHAHVHFSEKVVTLPHCYQPNDSQRRISDEPQHRREHGLPEQGFVFCCMNNVYKITPAVFEVWMRLLQQVPGSVLWLYGRIAEARGNLQREAQARGVAPDRLIFAPPQAPDKHLARLRLADLFLDTWPYNAHTTGSDALWAGLPVLTCTGETFASRVGASMLHAVGLPELVTHSFADYENLALCLAHTPELLLNLRQRLQNSLATAPLFDSGRYAKHLEWAFGEMYRQGKARADSATPLQAIVCPPTGIC